jgi:hypothetical protein
MRLSGLLSVSGDLLDYPLLPALTPPLLALMLDGFESIERVVLSFGKYGASTFSSIRIFDISRGTGYGG